MGREGPEEMGGEGSEVLGRGEGGDWLRYGVRGVRGGGMVVW